MLELIESNLLGILVIGSPLIVGALFCLILWRSRRSSQGQRPNGLVWLSSRIRR